jgi:hypothetical protein
VADNDLELLELGILASLVVILVVIIYIVIGGELEELLVNFV